MIARHLGHHIPGHPTIVGEDMSGASGILAANCLYHEAPHETPSSPTPHNMLPMPRVGQLSPTVDAEKFNWIGNMPRETGIVAVSSKAGKDH